VTFAEFVGERQRPLLRFAMVLTGDARLAEDIVADVLGRAFERWDRLATMSEPGAYLRRMVVNDFLSWRRRLSRVRPFAVVDPGSIGDPATAQAERSALLAMLAALPRRQRSAVVLRFYEDMSYAEIGGVLDCAPATARGYVCRALAALRIEMTDDADLVRPAPIQRRTSP
jgi:RNA polymerase sigma-70 factor (sigma-E family)